MDSFYSSMLVHSTDVELITKKWAQLAKQDGFKIADHESDDLEALAIFSMDNHLAHRRLSGRPRATIENAQDVCRRPFGS